MYRVAEKKALNSDTFLYRIEAPLIAKKAKAGQFVILRVSEGGERIPLTISDADREKGFVAIVFRIVGKTTALLSKVPEGGYISDFAGPLGKPSDLEGIKKACVVCGGTGAAIAFPLVKAIYESGAKADVVAGFRGKDFVILEEEFCKNSDRFFLCTDDGSKGEKAFVTEKLRELLGGGEKYDKIFVIGPIPMMKAVCEITREPKIKTVVSMNSIMLDGTGMCGACRLTVGGKTKFACVDGPEFDGHLVDFDEAEKRSAIYRKEEKESFEKHSCRLLGGTK
ncbi:MAG: sulfide/dihydroorotate dehydrogenase-like FAD/NAD-binding protein [Oscillospiraceae bacterium]|nr:sulfide/dihydroorotate dehydrogenase-like FAD/NAD-binding protein [Oscillospiraceae bacterium]